MAREKPTLSDEQRFNLAGACLTNARDLLREAKALRHDGALPYAQFLLGTAFEEVLKARYCIEEDLPSWKKWWQGFRSHESKLDLARRYWPELPEEATRTLLDLRERCLYVDVRPDGDPLTPHGLVDPGELDIAMLMNWDSMIRREALETVERLMNAATLSLPPIPN